MINIKIKNKSSFYSLNKLPYPFECYEWPVPNCLSPPPWFCAKGHISKSQQWWVVYKVW